MRRQRTSRAGKGRRGLSLLEMLVALSILSIIGVAVMGIVVSSLRVRRESQRAAEAQQFAYNVLERHKEYWSNLASYRMDAGKPLNTLPPYVRSSDLEQEARALGFGVDLRYGCLDRSGTSRDVSAPPLNCSLDDPELRSLTITLEERGEQRAQLYTEIGRPVQGGS